MSHENLRTDRTTQFEHVILKKYAYTYMYVITISEENREHKFEQVCGGVCGSVWREERRNAFIIVYLKNKIK